jgi:Leucine-rich repeat (LRR) protein
MTPEEVYAEALRRIRQVEDSGTASLDLSGLSLSQLPRELERLTSLRELNLSGCQQLSADLGPVAALTRLQTLTLSACEHLNGDLKPIGGLKSLRTLNLCFDGQLTDLSPLAGLKSLQTLNLLEDV